VSEARGERREKDASASMCASPSVAAIWATLNVQGQVMVYGIVAGYGTRGWQRVSLGSLFAHSLCGSTVTGPVRDPPQQLLVAGNCKLKLIRVFSRTVSV